MSADLMNRIEAAKGHVGVDWTDERAAAVGRGMMRRKRRREVVRASAVALAALSAVILAIFGSRGFLSRGSSPVASGPASSAPAVLALSEGSVVTPVDLASQVRTVETSATRVVVQVVAGAARFDVSRNPQRVFRVEAGKVAVEVLGTSFVVERMEGEQARVAVDRGRVRVSWEGNAVELGAGEQGVFPRPMTEPSPSASATSSSTPATPAPTAAPAVSAPKAATWRTLAQEGEFEKAWAAMQADGPGAVRNDAADLMLAADVARMSKHSDQAVAPLRKLLASHPGDPRAALAAFTLGRVLLDELGRPREAAEAFAKARAMGGAMAQDALAREVEAWSRAGDAATARARAEEYVRAYPGGRRERSVRKYGGLD